MTATADENEVAETYVDEAVHNPPSESNVGNRESVCGAIPSSSAIHTPLNYVSEVCGQFLSSLISLPLDRKGLTSAVA